MIKIYFGLIFLGCFCRSFSQTISGSVRFVDEKVGGAQVILKKDTQIVAYTFTDVAGDFNFKSIKEDSLYLQISHMNFETYSMFIKKPFDEKLRLELTEKSNFLEEIVIKKEVPIRQKRDTAVYDLSHFKDGSERVIEDVLKKLPGIVVHDDGKIFYKNKEIEALMIDGDDLFQNKYDIGSKNLDADAVVGVEAIENFNKNKVLHQVTRTNSVALNLKLKEGNPVLSARANLNNDFHSKYDNSITTLFLHSKFKGFSLNKINNLGQSYNDVPHFIDGNISSKTRIRNLISEGTFPQFLGTQNALLNDAFLTSNSLKFNYTKQLSSTFSMSYSKDRVWQNYQSNSRYYYDQEEMVYNSKDHQVKKPEIFTFNKYLEFYNQKNLQVNGTFTLENRVTKFTNEVVNNDQFIQNSVHSHQSFVGGKVQATQKISENSAINIHAIFSQDQSNQDFILSPSIAINETDFANRQKNEIKNNYWEGQLEYYKNWNRLKFRLTNTAEQRSEFLKSDLTQDNVGLVNFSNDDFLKSLINRSEIDVNSSYKRLRYGLSQTLNYQKLQSSSEVVDNIHYLFNVYLEIIVAKNHSINLRTSRQLENPMLANIYHQPILTSYQSLMRNDGRLGQIKSTISSLDYTISDFYNTFYLKASLTHTQNDKNYYSFTAFAPSLMYNNMVLLNQGNNRSRFGLSVHKLIPFIKVNFKYNGSYSFATNYNLVGTSDLRSIKNSQNTNEMELNFSPIKNLILNNKINYDFSFFKANDGQRNTLTQIKNEFSLNYKISTSVHLKSAFQTYIPNQAKKERYNFLDFEISYLMKKANCEFYLRGQNLLNHHQFQNIWVSDFSVSTYSYQLQERNILLGMIFKIL